MKSDKLATIQLDQLAHVTGGQFDMSQITPMISQIAGMADKMGAGGQASAAVGKFAPMISQIAGMVGQGGGTASA